MQEKNERQVAVVTGAARGIGLATARRLASDGFEVLMLDRSRDTLDQAVQDAQRDELHVSGVALDVTKRAEVADALASLARIDVVAAVHGVILVKPFLETTEEEFEQIMRVNVTGTFIIFQESLKKMKEGGKLIGFASRGVLGDTNTTAYISSKAAIVGMVRAMAFEYRSRNIAVNAIAPGFTNTAMVRDHLGAERLEAAAKLEPRGHAAHPDEIANVVGFLADPRTSFITGQTIFVDGGKSLGGLASPL